VCTYPFARTATPVSTFFPHFIFFFEEHPPIRSTKGSGKREKNEKKKRNQIVIILLPQRSSSKQLIELPSTPLSRARSSPGLSPFFYFCIFFFLAARASISLHHTYRFCWLDLIGQLEKNKK
jgi:hypothetical protein